MKEKQTIKCLVHDCKYCDLNNNLCNLEKIKVCNCSDDKNKEATMCNSYENKNKK